MAVFPGAIPTFAGFTSTHTLAEDNHAAQHNLEQAEIVQLAQKVGIDGSVDVDSHDYKLSEIASGEKAASIAAVLEAMYPIGAIFISTSSTNPASSLGIGTWTAFGEGRTLVSVDTGQTEFDTVEETGGAKTHTLTEAEMPSHTHIQNSHTHTTGNNAGHFAYGGGANASGPASGAGFRTALTGITTGAATAVNQNTGGGGAHNNLQPYITVYMWKRTA